MNKIFFTADTHLSHANIIKYCARPFTSVLEHDNGLIHNWNAVVTPNATVYHLGDFCFGDEKVIGGFLRRLNGNIKFVLGNHDKELRRFARHIDAHADLKRRVEFLGDYHDLKIEGERIILAHYAFRVWNKSHNGSFHLYGHSHGSLADDPHARSLDVGVDCHNYTPVSLERIRELMAAKLWRPIDHHGEREESGGVGLSKEDYAKLERKRMYEQLKREFE